MAESCTGLESLCIQHIQDFPTDPAILAGLPIVIFPELQFLTLLEIPSCLTAVSFLKSWDVFLAFLGRDSSQLPRICGLRIEEGLSTTSLTFFEKYGNKIEILEVSTLSTQLSAFVSLCTNLQRLKLLQALRRPLRGEFLPSQLPSVRRIDISVMGNASIVDLTSSDTYAAIDVDCLGGLLDEIAFGCSFKRLTEV
jgi:hypothetical protein